MPSPIADVLSPELLEQARNLVARARALVLGGGHGVHRSRHLGGGSEFSEYKEYSPGDDLRYVDWKVLGRTDRLVTKQFESDRRTDVQVLLDRSGSMGFGTTGGHAPTPWGVPWPPTKWDAARTLALALSFVFLRQADRVGLSVGDGVGVQGLPCRGGERALPEMARNIVSRGPTGDASLTSAIEGVLLRARRGLVVLVSDLLADSDRWLNSLAVHAARGREAWVIHVVDPAEISFPYDEPARFVDLEDSQTLSLNPRELARSYREEFAAHLAAQKQGCLDSGIHYLRVVTDAPLDQALGAFLSESSWA